jgi:xanthine dehydrogenase accessory factor
MKYSFAKIVEILGEEKRPVLASIVEVEGSSPQVPGATAVFTEAGLVAGTVGGGMLEAKAGEVAAECRQDRNRRLVTFRLDAETADAEGAICGGEATVLFDPRVDEDRAVFEEALAGLKGREPAVLLTRIGPPDGVVVEVARTRLARAGLEAGQGAGSAAGALTGPEIDGLLKAAKPLLKKDGEALLFAEALLPLPRLVIAGAGHVGRAVARLGSRLDFEVTVIDDRPEFANKDNVPAADTVVAGDFASSIRDIPPSPDDYFVIATRGHGNDAEALRACVRREAAYVGMIGSKTKVALTKKMFLEKGWSTAGEWDRVHTPIGLEIGSRTVEEIAVSIAAELVLVRSGRRKKEGP